MQTTKSIRRAKRVRSHIGGQRSRLSIYRSNAHIWAQIINDTTHSTLAAASDKTLTGTKTDRAIAVGQAVAKAALKAGITSVVFDRGSYRYHGRVKALADSARAAGLQF